MTPLAFKSAQSTLGMDNKALAAWLGVSLRSVEKYRAQGVEGTVGRAMGLAIALRRQCDNMSFALDRMSSRGVAEIFEREMLDDFKLTKVSRALDWRE